MKFLLILSLAIISLNAITQETDPKLYNPELVAQQQLEEALLIAKQENKHVLIQVGGNWCPWCIKPKLCIRKSITH